MTPDLARVDGTFIDYFGARLLVPKGHFDEALMLQGGIPEEHVIQTFRDFVRPGDTCLDIGANIGTHAFALASIVGSEGRVFAVEADIDNAAVLRRSIIESRSSNIVLLPIAAADRPGVTRLLLSTMTNSVFSTRAAASEVKAAGALPLDAVIRERVDFVKLDIEGAELLALRGMENILTYSRPIVLTEFAPGYILSALGSDKSREFLEFFLDRGYQGQVVDPSGALHPRLTVDELLESQAASKRDHGRTHIEILFMPTEMGGRLRAPINVPVSIPLSIPVSIPLSAPISTPAAAPASTPASTPAASAPAPVPVPAAPIEAPAPATPSAPPSRPADLTAYVQPPFLAVPPSRPGVPWRFEVPSLTQPVSQLCTSEQMEEPLWMDLCAAAGLDGASRHRKVWEFAYILAVLRAKGMLGDGRRGLGFGTGQEPLPSAFAAAGVHVTATDAPVDVTQSALWEGSNQWTRGLNDLWHAGLVPRAAFDRLVRFQAADMNAIPADLRGFDFCWSACCLEHLGSIRQGLDFIRNSLGTLRPGGIAVHTTEFNMLSNEDTMETPTLCLFRKRDIELLASELIEAGHEVEPLNFWPGANPVDLHIDLPPFSEPHLKLDLLGHVTTSIGMVVRKRG